jgi:hypothetical protein
MGTAVMEYCSSSKMVGELIEVMDGECKDGALQQQQDGW